MTDNSIVPDKNSHHQNLLLHSIKLAGKPILFLFTILGVLLVVCSHLITLFTRLKIRYPSYQLSSFLPQYGRIIIRPSIFIPKFVVIISIFLFVSSSAGLLFYHFVLRDLPDPRQLESSLPPLSTKIYDRHGQLLYQIYRDQNRTLVKLSDLPQHLIDATLSSEDTNYYSHPGLDLRAILRAIVANFRSRYTCYLLHDTCYQSIQGGSTITQQLVKNALLTPERTWRRKLKEAVLALRIETIYDKGQILEFYLNYVPYGGTSYGIEEATRYYFDKSSVDLDLPESALLAGLPVAPTTLSPFGRRPYLAKSRQHQVLDRMVETGKLSADAAFTAKESPLKFRGKGNGILAPHFVMYVEDLLVQQFGEDLVHYGGLEVVTTLDLSLQHLLESEINSELAKLLNLRVGNGAGLILAPQTGEILAMVGSRNFFDTEHDGQVNVTLQPRQPGSAVKPLTYALALMNGLTPNTMLDDSPICFRAKGLPPYCPENYDRRFHGRVTLRTALASSYNIPAIKLLNGLGTNKLVELGTSLGLTTWSNSSRFGLTLTLGGGEVTMLELANAYATFARGGSYLPTKSLLSVRNHASLPGSPPPSPISIIPEGVTYQISDILADNRARSPAFGSRSVLNIPGHQVAVKTGTSNELRDNWTIGYTSDYLVATWVGNNDNAPMSSVASGITGASPIWSRTMQALLSDSPPHTFTPPENLIKISTSCTDKTRYEYFIKGTEPRLNCDEQGGEIL